MKEFIKDIIIALIIVAAITFVIKPTIVKETSMEPTLYGNDYLILNKLSYIRKDHPDLRVQVTCCSVRCRLPPDHRRGQLSYCRPPAFSASFFLYLAGEVPSRSRKH